MMKAATTTTKVLTIATTSLLAGCMSTKTFEARVSAMEPIITACHQSVVLVEQSKMQSAVKYTDARDYAIVKMADALADRGQADPFARCNEVAMSYMQADQATRQALIGMATTLGAYGIGAWAVSDIFDSVSSLGQSKGNQVYSNSRVLDASEGGTIHGSSASGENVFIGTATGIDGSLVQGGVQPRQAIVNESVSTTSPSQSGTNEPPTVDPGDDQPVIQPVE